MAELTYLLRIDEQVCDRLGQIADNIHELKKVVERESNMMSSNITNSLDKGLTDLFHQLNTLIQNNRLGS